MFADDGVPEADVVELDDDDEPDEAEDSAEPMDVPPTTTGEPPKPRCVAS